MTNRWLRRSRASILLLILLIPCGQLLAQHAPPAGHEHAPASQIEPAIPGEAPAHQAAGHHEEENSQEKMIEELKLSPSVKMLARLLHVSAETAYWIGIILDFAVLALLAIWGLRKVLPKAFRARTAGIRQGIEEGRKASAEATERLAGIEAKLAKLGEEVSAMRAAAEHEAAGESERIQAAVEQEKKQVVEAADAEISAASRTARRELKAFAADLAVNLAGQRIQVDQATDEGLVRSFTAKLGAVDGKDGN